MNNASNVFGSILGQSFATQADFVHEYNAMSQQQMIHNAGSYNIGLQQALMSNTPEPKLARARRIAAEARAAHPEMQVRRIKP